MIFLLNNQLVRFALLAMFASMFMPSLATAAEGVANADSTEGGVSLFSSGAKRDILPKQRLQTGDVVKLVAGGQIEISYDNGCAEVLSQSGEYKVDACRCITSPFRKGKKDDYNATLIDLKGDILVNQGAKYVPAKNNMRIRNGDRILAMRNSSAKVTYDHGCINSVESFTVYDVDGCSACPLPLEENVRFAEQTFIPKKLLTDPLFISSVAGLVIVIDRSIDDSGGSTAISP